MTRDPRLVPIQAYLRRYPEEPGLDRLSQQLEAPEAIFSRRNMVGHITASGFVLTPDQSETLIVCHKGLKRWLQPGGHIDEEDNAIWQAAQREICEETGLTHIRLDAWHAQYHFEPVHIDTHPIPPRPSKQEGAHWHHDCLYLFVAEKTSLRLEEHALSGAAWCAIGDPRVPARLQRLYDSVLHHNKETPV